MNSALQIKDVCYFAKLTIVFVSGYIRTAVFSVIKKASEM